MKVICLLAFYMFMSQGSGASLNGLNQMDKKHEAEELEDQLHLEKRIVKTSSKREIDVEMTTTMEVTTAVDTLMTTELNEQNILEKFGVKGFVHLVSSVFERHPEVLNEFLARKSSLLVEHSSMGGQHHTRVHLPEAGDFGSHMHPHYNKPNLLNHRTLRRHYNAAEKRHQNHFYHGSLFRSPEKDVAEHQQQNRFGQKLKQKGQSEELALPETRSDVRKLQESERKNSSSSSSRSSSGSSSISSSGSSSSDDNSNYDDNIASDFMNNKNKQDNVNTDGNVKTLLKTTTEEARNNNGNSEVSTILQPTDRSPPASDVNKKSVVSKDDSTGDNVKFQYETDLQRTSFGEKKFSNGFPILLITKTKPMEVAQPPKVSRTQAENRILLVKHELQSDDQLTDKQLDSERNSSIKIIQIHKSTDASPQNTESNRQDRDWVGVGHARRVITSASKTVSHKLSKEIPSSEVGENKKSKEVSLPLQLPIYSHRRLIPRRTNRTKEIRSSEKNVALQSAAKNSDDTESKIQRTHQQMFKERRLTNHQRKPVMNAAKTYMTEIITQKASKDQDSNNDEKALLSLVSHLNTNSKQHKQ